MVLWRTGAVVLWYCGGIVVVLWRTGAVVLWRTGITVLVLWWYYGGSNYCVSLVKFNVSIFHDNTAQIQHICSREQIFPIFEVEFPGTIQLRLSRISSTANTQKG